MNTREKIQPAKWWIYGVLLAAAILLPLATNDRYILHILILICIWGISAHSMNLIMGYTGQANLALGGFFGIGAYATALFMLKAGINFWPALLLGALLTALIGFLIGLPTLRTKGSYFAIGTLCFNVIVFIAVERWESLTEGARGVMGIPGPAPIPLPFGYALTFETLPSVYFLVLAFLLLTMFAMYRVVRSLAGRSLMAVRENEDLSNSIGINTMRTKLMSFVLSTFIVGIAGGLYAVYIGFLDPEITSHHVTFEVLLFVVLGGIGTIWGPLVGAVVITILGEVLHYLDAYRLVAYGLMLVLFSIFLPQGFLGGMRSLWAKVTEKA